MYTELDDFEAFTIKTYRSYFKSIYNVKLCLLTYTNLKYVFLMEKRILCINRKSSTLK